MLITTATLTRLKKQGGRGGEGGLITSLTALTQLLIHRQTVTTMPRLHILDLTSETMLLLSHNVLTMRERMPQGKKVLF